MRIGIDIDGVLTDIIQYLCDYSSKYFFERYGRLDINFNVYSLAEMFNVSEEEARESYISSLEDYATKEPARHFASEVINKLRDEGNQIYIISSRCNSNTGMLGGRMPDLVKQWLKNNNINYDKIYLRSK